MFKKLRNRFLLLNLIIITVLMMVSFFAIFMITYTNVHNDIQQELTRASEIRLMMGRGHGQKGLQAGQGPQNMPPPQEQSVSFSILTDSAGNTLSTISYLNLEDSFYDSAKKEALAKNSDTGTFNIDGNTWTFIRMQNNSGFSYTFLNITSRQAILTNLIYTFLLTAVVMLLAIFAISKFFADRAIKPIKDAFDKQKQFVADSSHELKTPLAIINTNTDVLLANRDKTIESQEKWLRYIKSEAERMTKLTNDLLYLTRIDYSESKMIFANLNLSEALINVILTMEAVIFESGIQLNYEQVEPSIMINGNTDQLKQVVMILLDNAVKYTDRKGKIDISLVKQHHHVILTVTNTGRGIAEEHINKIFDRFYRTDESRSRESGGYGLGLAIAKAIVEQHGGEIHAASVVNDHTSFTVDLPF